MSTSEITYPETQ